jgi:hypothetical protein
MKKHPTNRNTMVADPVNLGHPGTPANQANDLSEAHVAGKMAGRNGKGRNFNITVDNVPYFVKAVPYAFNGETRFYVSINGGTEHVFTRVRELGRLRSIDLDSFTLPSTVEDAISDRLQSKEEGKTAGNSR